jgi:hypothetical protein
MGDYFIDAYAAAAILRVSRDVVVGLCKRGRLKDHGETKPGLTRHTYKFLPAEVQALKVELDAEELEKAEKKAAEEAARADRWRAKAAQTSLPIGGDYAQTLANLHLKVDQIALALVAIAERMK